MDMNKRKVFFLAVAVFSLVQIILVLLVDCTVIAWVSKYENEVELLANVNMDGPMVYSIAAFYTIDKSSILMGWALAHMVIHVEWIVSTIILIIFAVKPDPRNSYQVMQFAMSLIIICACDAGAGIHTSVIIAQEDTSMSEEPQLLFFPFFFTKAGLIWIWNVAASVIMLITLSRIHKARRGAASRQNLAKSEAIADSGGKDNPGSYWREGVIEQQTALPRIRAVVDAPKKLDVEQPPSTAAYNKEYMPSHMGPDLRTVQGPLEEYSQWGDSSLPSSPSASHFHQPQTYH